MNGIFKFLMRIGQKMNSDHLPHLIETKNVQRAKTCCMSEGFDIFRERRCHFSLRFRAIRPSDFFEPRRKVALRGEDNTWTPVFWSFDKLCEVWV